jgi:hypothetical protein
LGAQKQEHVQISSLFFIFFFFSLPSLSFSHCGACDTEIIIAEDFWAEKNETVVVCAHARFHHHQHQQTSISSAQQFFSVYFIEHND